MINIQNSEHHFKNNQKHSKNISQKKKKTECKIKDGNQPYDYTFHAMIQLFFWRNFHFKNHESTIIHFFGSSALDSIVQVTNVLDH